MAGGKLGGKSWAGPTGVGGSYVLSHGEESPRRSTSQARAGGSDVQHDGGGVQTAVQKGREHYYGHTRESEREVP
ncbi:hypothetical protein JYU34_021594 [Plutella xylostella]|uniref:Uncharacterized protein n=1 Tax=Plutella xylostella TaxID=51655 RepID=A0ABQ7PTY0_PLUXY|nr:hypothetical protein JYU34_021594 [Plutella xylostella]